MCGLRQRRECGEWNNIKFMNVSSCSWQNIDCTFGLMAYSSFYSNLIQNFAPLFRISFFSHLHRTRFFFFFFFFRVVWLMANVLSFDFCFRAQLAAHVYVSCDQWKFVFMKSNREHFLISYLSLMLLCESGNVLPTLKFKNFSWLHNAHALDKSAYGTILMN